MNHIYGGINRMYREMLMPMCSGMYFAMPEMQRNGRRCFPRLV